MFRPFSSIAFRCAIGLAGLSLFGCGGSQQSLPSAVRPIQPNESAAFSKVTLVIKIPRRAATSSASRRQPLFISPSIASVTVSVSATGSPATSVTSNVVCSTAVPPVCTVTATILAPVQKQDTFTVTAYDGPNATGNVLSQGSVVYPVNAGQATQIPVVLQGAVESIVAVSVANPNPLTGSAGSSSVSVSAADADGNVIVGQYQNPVSLQLFENDPDGLFSFVQGGSPKTTATVASSTAPATLYLRAKTDSTTPDDATIVATLANTPYVPGTSAYPPLSSLGEVTTACPATSPQCVFYPTGLNLLATQVPAQGGGTSSTVNTWNSTFVFPGTSQDPGGGTSIWSFLNNNGTSINRFDTVADSFSNVTVTAAPSDVTVDIAGSLWGAYQDPSSGVTAAEQFATDGTTSRTIALTSNPGLQNFNGTLVALIGSSFDSNGQLWSADPTLTAVNVSTGRSTACSFESTDVNFASSELTALAVGGSNVWIAVSNTVDGNSYAFKIPATLTATGCDLTTLETSANEFELNSAAGAFPVEQIVVDSAGNAYMILVSSVYRITPAGQSLKLIDTGVSVTQVLSAGTVDPSGASLYLIDTTNGVLYKASASATSTNLLPSIVLPPVFGVAQSQSYLQYPNYVPFFTPDGSLWMGAAPIQNPALPFSLLGIGGGYGAGPEIAGGLDQIRLARVTFAAREIRSHLTREQILRNIYARKFMQRGRFRQKL